MEDRFKQSPQEGKVESIIKPAAFLPKSTQAVAKGQATNVKVALVLPLLPRVPAILQSTDPQRGLSLQGSPPSSRLTEDIRTLNGRWLSRDARAL